MRDYLDETTLFSRDEAERRRQDREEARVLAAKREEQFAAQEIVTRERVRRMTVESNERAIRFEYELVGVQPPPGNLVSLTLLRSMGWTIEEMEGKRVLVAPPPPPEWKGFTDNDSLRPDQRKSKR